MTPKVAIIILHWNSFGVTNDCINSIYALTYTEYDIIVVDNGSVDQSGEKLKELHPNIILIRSSVNMGFTGNNLALDYALQQSYKYSLLLNNDTFVEKDFLGILVHYMEQHPEAGAVQPRIFYNHDRTMLWNGGSYFSKLWGFTYTKGFNKKSTSAHTSVKDVDWITGCAFFIRNEVLPKSGLLSVNTFMYSEDVDLAFRIKKLGYRLVYVPDAIVYHIAGISNEKSSRTEGKLTPFIHYLNQRNRIWILKKYTPVYCIPTVVLFNFFYILAVMGYFVARFRFRKLWAMCRAVKDGLTGSIKL
jgi:GT2 family glycosyltransferase